MEEGIELRIEGFNDEELQSVVDGLTTERELVERLVKIVDVGFVDSHTFNAFTERLERFFINDVSFLISLPKESPSLTDDDKLLWKYRIGDIYINAKEDEKTVELRNIFKRLHLQVMEIRFEDGFKCGLIDLDKVDIDDFINKTKRYKKWYIRAIEKLSPEFKDLKAKMRTDIEAAYAGNKVRKSPFFKWLIFTEYEMGLNLNFTFDDYSQKGVAVSVAKAMTVDLTNIHYTPKLAEKHIFKYCQISRNEIEIAKQSVFGNAAPTDGKQKDKKEPWQPDPTIARRILNRFDTHLKNEAQKEEGKQNPKQLKEIVGTAINEVIKEGTINIKTERSLSRYVKSLHGQTAIKYGGQFVRQNFGGKIKGISKL